MRCKVDEKTLNSCIAENIKKYNKKEKKKEKTEPVSLRMEMTEEQLEFFRNFSILDYIHSLPIDLTPIPIEEQVRTKFSLTEKQVQTTQVDNIKVISVFAPLTMSKVDKDKIINFMKDNGCGMVLKQNYNKSLKCSVLTFIS